MFIRQTLHLKFREENIPARGEAFLLFTRRCLVPRVALTALGAPSTPKGLLCPAAAPAGLLLPALLRSRVNVGASSCGLRLLNTDNMAKINVLIVIYSRAFLEPGEV